MLNATDTIKEKEMRDIVLSWFDKAYPNGFSVNDDCVNHICNSCYGCTVCNEDNCVQAFNYAKDELIGEFLTKNPAFEMRYMNNAVCDYYGDIIQFVGYTLGDVLIWKNLD